MSHSPATSDRYYKLYQKSQMAVPMSMLISRVMETPTTAVLRSSGDGHGDAEENLADQSDAGDPADAGPVPNSNRKTNSTDAEDQGDLSIKRSADSSSDISLTTCGRSQSEPVHTTHGRRSFSPQESSDLLRLCDRHLDTRGGPITTAQIMHTLETSSEGRTLVAHLKQKFEGKDWAKKIVDKIRCERKKRLRTCSE